MLKRSKVKLPVQLKAMLAGRKQVRLKRSKVRLSVQLKAMLAGRKQVRWKRSKVRLSVQQSYVSRKKAGKMDEVKG